jgi:hypothetical protein
MVPNKGQDTYGSGTIYQDQGLTCFKRIFGSLTPMPLRAVLLLLIGRKAHFAPFLNLPLD